MNFFLPQILSFINEDITVILEPASLMTMQTAGSDSHYGYDYRKWTDRFAM